MYLPDGYDTSGVSYPVLYLIHGHGGSNMTWSGSWRSEVNIGVIVDRLIQEKNIKPLIVVCPDVNRVWFTGHGQQPIEGIAPYDEYLLHDIVSFVDSTFRTIPNRESRAIAGHSQGGYDSVYMALTHPEVFSIAGGFSSFGLGTIRGKLAALLKGHDEASNPIQFWLYSGTKDQYGANQPNRDFVKVLKANGLPTEYTEDDGTHESKLAQRLTDFLEFLSNFLK